MVDMVKDQAETSGFSQIVTGYTRCWNGQSSSLLDQCWTNCATRISSCRNLVCGSSDHNLIEIIVRLKGINKSPKETVKRNCKNFNSKTFKEMVAGIDWTEVLESNDVDISYDLFETKIRNILDRLAPMKKVQISSKHKSWLTDSTRELIVQRDKTREEARTSGEDSKWRDYRTLRNECTSRVRKDRAKQYSDTFVNIDKNKDSKDLYNQAKTMLGWNSGKFPESFLVDGVVTNSPRQVANIQLNYFNDKIHKLISDLPQATGDPCRYLLKSMRRWRMRNDRNTQTKRNHSPPNH